MKRITFLLSLTFLFFTFSSCNEQLEINDPESVDTEISIDKKSQIQLSPTTLTKSQIMDVSCGEPVTGILYAGQNIEVGTITVSNDEKNLYVTYEVTDDWWLKETHLYVGSRSDFPLNGGDNPVIGKFPYHGDHGLVKSYPFTIPLADLEKCFIISAHASVVKLDDKDKVIQSETAFGCIDKSETWEGSRWGCFFEYCKEECIEDNCMNGFAFKYPHTGNDKWSYCFLDDSFENWGWTMGPFDNSKRYNNIPLYTNGEKDGTCKPENATAIGYAEFSIDDPSKNEVHVKIVLENPNYMLKKSHVYIGEDKYPLKEGTPTIDPYYYGNTNGVLVNTMTDTYTITNVNSSSFYIIIHVDICPVEDNPL